MVAYASGQPALRSPGELRLHRFFIIDKLLHAGPAFDPLEMRLTVWITGRVDAELGAAAQAPEEMGVRGGEMIEEEFAPRQRGVGDLIALEQKLAGAIHHLLLRS